MRPNPATPLRSAVHASIGVMRAHATLREASRFLGSARYPIAKTRMPSKVIGNGLRELDRFLSVLIDEVADATAGLDEPSLRLLRTRRNTANKLQMLHAAHGRGSPHDRRLRALGRSRDCLFYSDGLVRRADSRAGLAMTTGWHLSSAVPIGDRLDVRHRDLADVCRFYDRLADELIAETPTP
jgi:hypothetical protein